MTLYMHYQLAIIYRCCVLRLINTLMRTFLVATDFKANYCPERDNINFSSEIRLKEPIKIL